VTNVLRMLVVSLVAVSLAAGCGGDDDGSSGTSTSEWADGLCTAINDWTGSLTEATDSLRESPSVDGLKSAVDDLQAATGTFVDEVKGLGTPDTESGEQAKDAIDQLADDVDGEVDEMKSAADDVSSLSGVPEALSTISGSLASIGQQVSSALSDVGQVDPGGELQDAFEQSDACQDLRN
jgi:uncharacterized protein YoxC